MFSTHIADTNTFLSCTTESNSGADMLADQGYKWNSGCLGMKDAAIWREQ